MKRIVALVCLCVPMAAQMTMSGTARYSGNSVYSTLSQPPGGAPLSYNARTDTCVVGYASDPVNCIQGATTGQNGSGLTFRYRDTDPLPFANLAPMNSDGYDPDFGSYLALVTDQNLAATIGWNNINFTTGDGGNASYISRDGNMFMIGNNGGSNALMWINTARFFAHQCNPAYDSQWTAYPSWMRSCFTYSGLATTSQDQTGNSQAFNLGAFQFSRNASEAPNVMYETDSSAHTQVYKDLICPDATTYPGCAGQATYPMILRSVYVDFTSNSPVACSTPAPAGQDRGPGLMIPADYQSMWGGVGVADDDSVSMANEGAGNWHASTIYTVNESFILPTWTNCPTAGRCMGYQTVACTGDCKSGTSEPDFVGTAPSEGNTLTETTGTGSVTWLNIGKLNNQGPGFDVLIYKKGVGCYRVNTRIGKMYAGTGVSGPSGQIVTDTPIACSRIGQSTPCPMPDMFTIHGAGLTESAQWVGMVPTGGGGTQSDSILQANTQALGGYSCRSNNGLTPWECYHYELDLAIMSAPTVHICIDGNPGVLGHCAGHEVHGYNYFYSDKQQIAHAYAQPNNADGSPAPGIYTIPSSLPGDHHGSGQNQNPQDTAPMFLAQTDIPMPGRQSGDFTPANGSTPGNYGAKTLLYHSEDMAVTPLDNSDPNWKAYRFSSNFNSGNSPFFDTQNAMGFVSINGRMFAWTTDMMGTRGSTSPDWKANTSYGPGGDVNPSASNTNQSTFQNVGSAAGTSYSSQPNWNLASHPGDVICDDGTNRVNPVGGCGTGVLAWTNQNAPCNKLRADTNPNNSTAYALGQRVLAINGIAANDIFQLTAVQSGNSCISAASGTKWGVCSNDGVTNCTSKTDCGGNSCVDSYGSLIYDGACTWKNLGQNDCSSAIVLLDLTSAHH